MRCCSFPQGRRAVQALLWGIFAYLFCMSATMGCSFMKIDGFIKPEYKFYVTEEAGSSTIGPFGYEELGSGSIGYTCLTYNPGQLDHLLDGPFKAARAFAMIAHIFIGGTLLFLIASACVWYSPMMLYTLAGLSFAGSGSLMLTFVMFASKLTEDPYNGKFHVGGGMAIVGFIFSVVTGILILQIPPPGSSGNYTVSAPTSSKAINVTGQEEAATPRRNFPAPKRATPDTPETAPDVENDAFQPGTETVTETAMPDGSRKIVKTTVELDGSLSVTETIVRTD